MKIYIIIVMLLLPIFCAAQSIIPQPASVIKTDKIFKIKNATQISYKDQSLKWLATYLKSQLYAVSNVTIKHNNSTYPSICLLLKQHANGALQGSYRLKVTASKVLIEAGSSQGVFYGIQSLLQLVNRDAKTISAVDINDAPRYQWRGFMLDESRHFFGKKR